MTTGPLHAVKRQVSRPKGRLPAKRPSLYTLRSLRDFQAKAEGADNDGLDPGSSSGKGSAVSEARIEDSPSEALPWLAVLTAQLALLGGIIVLSAAILVCVSVAMRWATSNSVPGDFELVQIAVALSAFAFLPYGQLRRSNISVETFTARLPPRVLAWLEATWDFSYAFVAAFIAWRLAVGAFETISNGTTTMISGIPIGWGIAAVAVMAGFLAITALVVGICRLGRRA